MGAGGCPSFERSRPRAQEQWWTAGGIPSPDEAKEWDGRASPLCVLL